MRASLGQLMESATIGAGLVFWFAAVVNFSEGALDHATFWAVLGVGAAAVYLMLRVEYLIKWHQNQNTYIEELFEEPGRDTQGRSSRHFEGDWGHFDWKVHDDE